MKSTSELGVQSDHDHYCRVCDVYWGCPDACCHLPTQELCAKHGGGWNSAAIEHVHECTECDEHDGEFVSNVDWIHKEAECKLPRRWPCNEHRDKPPVGKREITARGSSAEGKEPFWWAEQVNSLVQKKKTGAALTVLNRLLDMDIDRPYVLLYKIRLLQRMGRLKEAIAWICLEAQLNPEDPKVLALRDELMEFYPFSLFEPRPLSPDVLAAFRKADTDWPDVAGMNEVKIQLHNDIILPLKHPEKFQRFKVGLPNGILFYGPPGCGKTFLARKLAEKVGHNFRELRMSDVGSSYVHETGRQLREAFEAAEKTRPTILFLDEIDSLAANRSGRESAYRVEEVNELLSLMDKCSERGILVIGACNSLERIDPAMLRPGRFDKKIHIGPPDEAGRYALFELLLRSRPRSDAIGLDELVKRTQGYSNADIDEVVKEAARLAAVAEAPKISERHLGEAIKSIPSSLVSGTGASDTKRRSIGFRTQDKRGN
jgi:transitional endoplasmic reticulum ATPase